MDHDEKKAQLAASARGQKLLARFRELALELPETAEVEAWGHPTFRVRNKIFASFGGRERAWSCGFKCSHELQAALVESDERFSVAAYVGKHGWVSMSLKGRPNWKEIGVLVRGSYRLVAPKTLARTVPED